MVIIYFQTTICQGESPLVWTYRRFQFQRHVAVAPKLLSRPDGTYGDRRNLSPINFGRYIDPIYGRLCPPHRIVQGRRKVWKSGGANAISMRGHNRSPLVEIGLTDLPKSGGAMALPAPPGTTGLHCPLLIWRCSVGPFI